MASQLQLTVSEMDFPLIVYYCRANISTTGKTVRVVDRNVRPQRVIDCRDVRLLNSHARMADGNSRGKAKASGARCVLEVIKGTVEIVD